MGSFWKKKLKIKNLKKKNNKGGSKSLGPPDSVFPQKFQKHYPPHRKNKHYHPNLNKYPQPNRFAWETEVPQYQNVSPSKKLKKRKKNPASH